jgi:hypothetical protein
LPLHHRSCESGLRPPTQPNIPPASASQAGDPVAIPQGAVFQDAFLGGVIDVDQAKALGIAFSPLEIVHQRPGEIAVQGYACLNSIGGMSNVAFHEGDTLWVVHLASPNIIYAGTSGGGIFIITRENDP